jgi:hypothetical protein
VKGALYRRLSSKRGFRENRRSDGNTLLKGANEFMLVISIFLDRFE